MKYNDISIVILLYKTPIETLQNLDNYKDFNLYILDQSNDIKLQKKIKKKLPRIKYYGLTTKNRGFAKGINFLVKKVKTKYFLCTQPDTIISKKSILELKKTFKNKNDVIITVPKIKQFKNYSLSKKLKKIIPVKTIIGAIFLADTKKFIDIGMFDESFFFYWEDMDLSKRIENNFLKIYLNPNSKADHAGEKSVKENIKSLVIRKVNFKYGEQIFQFKYKKLRSIKLLREPIKFFILAFFNILILRFTKALECLCFIYAIFKFVFFFKKNDKNRKYC